ncbi:type II toxin-antitoxin system RelE/ParE family toxin [Novosphingobium sp.]|uniref:type II toxin-antitoxin system RelE/ParE family toxin n=1 Tax=Novosphingobium sp. TaxID=1874826 RepID=UPI003BA89FC6
MSYQIQQVAEERLAEIYAYTLDQWGDQQAERYLRGLFERFEAIAARLVPWRPIPGAFGQPGYFCRYESHFIYWRLLDDETVGIVTVLHARMHQLSRFRDEFA